MSPPPTKHAPGRKHPRGTDAKARKARSAAAGAQADATQRSVAESRPRVKSSAQAKVTSEPAKGDRIAKVMARAGLCSRREAERWIEDGRVRVNGKKLKSPAFDVGLRDDVTVDGEPLPNREPVRIWRYHKPKGLVTTHRDPQGRATVFDNLPASLPRVISVGRLDYNTEGLLLLTNDGDLARHLELPATGWLRRYRVRAHGRITAEQLKPLADGMTIDGTRYGPIEATLDQSGASNHWLTLGLREGKNREVRRVLGALGLDVNRLIRISFGPFQLLDLKPGTTDLVRRKVLADQLGPQLADRFQLTGEEEVSAPPRRRGGVAKRKTASPVVKKSTKSTSAATRTAKTKQTVKQHASNPRGHNASAKKSPRKPQHASSKKRGGSAKRRSR